ncbi:MAG: alpha/beta hydrolase [Burkholderiales bacterium]|nr:alpha/beta hydrolase [Burkholderiales bacterium]
MKPSRSEFVPVRGLAYHVRLWGDAAAPKLFMVHGWMDVSASFQFLVDALRRDWLVIAPDWRGYGLTQRQPADAYWFADYIADLDFIARHYSPEAPINLVGHSLGGNVASHYAGARPERVARLVNLEGFGMRSGRTEEAPGRYRRFMDQLAEPPRLRPYASFADLAARMRQGNPRLTAAKADFLARHWGTEIDGKVVLLADPAHKIVNATLFRIDEAKACWAAITAPTLVVAARDSEMLTKWIDPQEYRARLSAFAHLTEAVIDDAGHMLHHDQPEALARLIEDFLP